MAEPRTGPVSHLTHWGAFHPEVRDGTLVAARPHHADPDPSALLDNIPGAVRHPTRVSQPMVRAGWLAGGAGPSEARGADPFVPVSWDEALDLVAGELRRVYAEHGGEAVFGGSYGWSSAGRFHHAQSQVHRFLNCAGGYVRSVNTYSYGASEVILPHVLTPIDDVLTLATSWSVIAEHSELVVCFGGIPGKNSAVASGGVVRHLLRDQVAEAARRGVRFELFSPLRDDLAGSAGATWHPVRPGTDVAVMLGLAHTLVAENLVDRDFLATYTAGYPRFEKYLLGESDGQPKTAGWAARLAEIPAESIVDLARRMAARRTMVLVTLALQRVDHGEQVPWMALTLAAMLGQIGLPGGGFGHGYGSETKVGNPPLRFGFPALPQGTNPVREFIPVARIADMLLHPGMPYDYDGARKRYPDIKLVYWAGGNPFHHHQHIGRLRRAFARPDTIIVHEPHWTATARHADIVLPATMSVERNDIGATQHDTTLIAMRQAVRPAGQARDDYDIFTGLARRLGVADAFTEGRTETDWLRWLYTNWQRTAADHGYTFPDFAEFWRAGQLDLPHVADGVVFLGEFRKNPDAAPLSTPTGKIEIFSETVAAFDYPDCAGHPTWYEPVEWLGAAEAARFPLHLIANNPATRLHSQLDVGATSQRSKVRGREPVRLHPDDAAARGIADGDVVRLFNDRGGCLAGAVLSADVRPGVVQLSTGAWYDPLHPDDPDSMCVHGNVNVLTRDNGASRLSQGPIGQHALVQVERWTAELPPVRVMQPPPIKWRADGGIPS